jgi:regulator of cell morphogenesis and NO signaling
MTINETIARFPATIAVFNRFGMDSCCGGGVSLRGAATRDGVDADVLLSALREAIAASE